MFRRLACTAFVVIAYVQSPPMSSQSPWKLPASDSTYMGTAAGRRTDADGASVTLYKAAAAEPSNSAAPAAPFGAVSATVPAEPLRGRRVTLHGELQTRGAGGASLWLRVDKTDGMVILDNGQDRAVKGDAEWTPFTVSLPVPSAATSIVVGVVLQGAGSVTARAVRIEAGTGLLADIPVAPDAQKVLDAAIDIVKKNAWMRGNIDWAVMQPDLRTMSGGATASSDIYPAIRFLLSSLKDRHSFLMLPAATTAFRTGGAANPPIEVKALADGIGYVDVPAYSGIDQTAARAFATKTHEELSATAGQAGCGWIVDLRGNGGGNMWPMLAGLKPFLGDEPLGTFVGRESSSQPWKAGQSVGVDPPAPLRTLEQAWVAVLTGPRTASSGEAVTISFKGRPHTRSFGQPTNGLSSANGTFPLQDGAMILLTTSIEADRTGRQYGEKVDPDEVIPTPASGSTAASGLVNPAEDGTIEAAKAWLKRSCAR